MLDRHTVERLGAWEGYRLKRVVWPETAGGTVEICLEPTRKVMRCECCGRPSRQVHQTTRRRVGDRPTFEHRVVLVVPRRRLQCELCGGSRLERLSWLSRYRRVTDRLAEACGRLLEGMTIQGVARFYGLGWHTVKAIDKARLAACLPPPDSSQIRYLAMDEFALHKGHRYSTVVVEPTRCQVLWVGQGRSRATARAFFEQLPAGAPERIEAVAIDMTTAYELEIQAHCPQAEMVYDLFHVVAKYGREVIDRVRVDEANRLRQDKPARKVVKSARSLLLRNRSNLDARQAVRLDELLEANQPLLTVYLRAMSSSDSGTTAVRAGP